MMNGSCRFLQTRVISIWIRMRTEFDASLGRTGWGPSMHALNRWIGGARCCDADLFFFFVFAKMIGMSSNERTEAGLES